MQRLSMLSAAMLVLLAGCGPGLPFGPHSDPNAADAVEQTKSLVDDCQGRFQSAVDTALVNDDSSPIITRADDITSIRLEGRPKDSDAIDPLQYSCSYDNAGQLAVAGLVH